MNISYFNIFCNANLPIKLVIIKLLMISIISWIIILKKQKLIKKYTGSTFFFENNNLSKVNLKSLYINLLNKKNKPIGIELMFILGFKEFLYFKNVKDISSIIIIKNIERAMSINMIKDHEDLYSNLSFLENVLSIIIYISTIGAIYSIINAISSLALKNNGIEIITKCILEILVISLISILLMILINITKTKCYTKINIIMLKYKQFNKIFISTIVKSIYRSPSINIDNAE